MRIKKVEIEGKEFTLYCSGGTPRRYRTITGKDIFADMSELVNSDGEIQDTGTIEDLAYVMSIKPGTTSELSIDEWLEQFDDPMTVMGVAQDVLDLWLQDIQTQSTAPVPKAAGKKGK